MRALTAKQKKLLTEWCNDHPDIAGELAQCRNLKEKNMPEIYLKEDIYIEDYFCKFGFDDGAEEHIGWNFRETAMDILNKHLNPLNIKVQKEDISSSHNNCRLGFYSNNKELEIDYDNMRCEKDWAEQVAFANDEEHFLDKPQNKYTNIADKIVCALQEAEKEFNKEVLDDLTKILKTPDEDMALLVGQLKDENAQKIMEDRFKSISIMTLRKVAKEAKTVKGFVNKMELLLKGES